MTHEVEELQHDLSKLQEKVQQISLSQRATKNEMEVLKKGVEEKIDGLKKGVEAKMDGLKNDMESKMDGMQAKMDDMEANMEDMKNYLKVDMEGFKGGLTKLIQEMIPNGKKVVQETHDENKINVNCDFINSNVGGKNHHIPKMDMRKFDGKDPVTWILDRKSVV